MEIRTLCFPCKDCKNTNFACLEKQAKKKRCGKSRFKKNMCLFLCCVTDFVGVGLDVKDVKILLYYCVALGLVIINTGHT